MSESSGEKQCCCCECSYDCAALPWVAVRDERCTWFFGGLRKEGTFRACRALQVGCLFCVCRMLSDGSYECDEHGECC